METDQLLSASTPLASSALDEIATTSNGAGTDPNLKSTIQSSARSAYLITLVVFFYRLALYLPSTTFLEITLTVVCQIFWISHDPPVDPGDVTKDMCDDPVIEKYFAIIMQIISVLVCFTGFTFCGLTSHFSGKFGRKPVLLFYLLSNLATVVLLVSTLFARGSVQATLLFLFIIVSSIGEAFQFDLIVNIFVVDITTPNNRTSILSLVAGAGALGSLPAFFLGGLITERTQNPLIVYYIAFTILILLISSTWIFLPESFTTEQRKQLRDEQETETIASSHRARGGIMSKIKAMVSTTLHPLAFLWPPVDPITEKRNLRVLWCAAHSFFSALGSGYISTAMLVYLTTKAHFKPDENGLVLTTIASSASFSMIVIMPLLMKYVRPLVEPSTKDTEAPKTGFEILIVAVSCLVDLTSIAFFPFAKTRGALFLIIALHGISNCRMPALRTVTVASVEPVRSGEALSAVDMARTSGSTLSGLVLGTILSATIATNPIVTFWTYSCFGILSVVVLVLVRDRDRYIHPVSLGQDEGSPEN